MSRHSLSGTEVQAGVRGLSREVGLHRAVIIGAIAVAVNIATAQHWITLGLSTEILRYADEALTFVAAVGAGAWIRTVTTPADQQLQPRNSAGQDLVPDPSAADVLDDADPGDAAAALDPS